jgi:hypothetical protein
MNTIYIVESEHWWIPGHTMKAFTLRARADEEAASLVNILRADVKLTPCATAKNWQARLNTARTKRGREDTIGDGDVWVTELELDNRA